MARLLLPLMLWLSCLTGPAAAAEGPEEVVRDTSDRVLAFLRTEGEAIKTEPARVYRLVDDVVLPVFDFQRMSQWVLGKHWRNAAPAQREQFVAEFRNLLVRTYSTALFEYSNEQVEVGHAIVSEDGQTATVKTEVIGHGPEPIPIDYRLHRTGSDWKVYDVSVSGVSLVSTYRNSFSSQIQSGGLDALIQDLATRNRKVGEQARLERPLPPQALGSLDTGRPRHAA